MEEEKKEGSKTENRFTNDGSFLEMFKKQMAEKNKTQNTELDKGEPAEKTNTSTNTNVSETTEAQNKPRLKSGVLPLIGKRRGNNMKLKTGTVKKKKEDEEESSEKDAWSKYMAEVKKYKGSVCQEEDKTRPLVK